MLFNIYLFLGLIERNKQITMDADILIPNIAGFLTSYSARKNILDIDDVLVKLKKEIELYYQKRNSSFALETNSKSLKFRDCEVK